MAHSNVRASFSRPPAPFLVVNRPGSATLANIVRASALMAQADGRVVRAERHGLLRFLRSRDLLPHVGRGAAIAAYEAEIARSTTAADSLDAIGQHRGRRAAHLIASAAAYVAVADGRVEQSEMDLLCRMRERLGLDSEELPA